MTVAELRRAAVKVSKLRLATTDAEAVRDAAILEAVAEGWTHAQISEATGLTRARIGQIALTREGT